MKKWESLKNVNSGHDLYFDFFGWVEVGQISQRFAAAMGILVRSVSGIFGL